MLRRQYLMNHLLAGGFLMMGLAATLLGMLKPLGHRPVESLQGWWTLRRYHQADVDQDYPALLDLGRIYLEQTGQGDLLEFAAYKVGYGASGPSIARVPEDALHWARLGIDALQAAQEELPDPWTGLQTQAYILVERLFPLTHDPEDLNQALQAVEDRLAAGGGLEPVSLGLRDLYLEFLNTPKNDRNVFLLSHLEREALGEGQ